VAESLVGVLREQPIRLIIDTTKLGFYHRMLTVSIDYRNGFDLEATHLQNLERLSRLVLGVCLLHVWRISLGSWAVKSGQRHLDRKNRRDKSCFRLGWNWLERCLVQGQCLRLRFVPCTPKG
jgi:hypothetical protein